MFQGFLDKHGRLADRFVQVARPKRHSVFSML
jgi:hypothetical protein